MFKLYYHMAGPWAGNTDAFTTGQGFLARTSAACIFLSSPLFYLILFFILFFCLLFPCVLKIRGFCSDAQHSAQSETGTSFLGSPFQLSLYSYFRFAHGKTRKWPLLYSDYTFVHNPELGYAIPANIFASSRLLPDLLRNDFNDDLLMIRLTNP